jgi:hypothetical protein
LRPVPPFPVLPYTPHLELALVLRLTGYTSAEMSALRGEFFQGATDLA